MSKLFCLILSVVLMGCSYTNGNPPKTSTIVLAPIDTSTLMEQPKENGEYTLKTFDVQRKFYGHDNWGFNLVGTDWELVEATDNVANGAISYVSVNSKSKSVIISFVKENRLDQDALQFHTFTVSYLNKTASNIDKAYEITFNGNTFTHSHFVLNNGRTLVWTTIKGNYGYILSCQAHKDTENICDQAIQTLQIL